MSFAEAQIDEKNQNTGSKTDGEVFIEALSVSIENNSIGNERTKQKVNVEFAVILILIFSFRKGNVRWLRLDSDQIEECYAIANHDVLTSGQKRWCLDRFLSCG